VTTRPPMKKCPNCDQPLTRGRVDDFDAMVFLECRDCRIIWDYVSPAQLDGARDKANESIQP